LEQSTPKIPLPETSSAWAKLLPGNLAVGPRMALDKLDYFLNQVIFTSFDDFSSY
jgi:hypothetical protein